MANKFKGEKNTSKSNFEYFLVRPSEFWRYGEVNIDGEYPQVVSEDFDISKKSDVNDTFNYLILRVPCKEIAIGKFRFGKYAREVFTGNKFRMTIDDNKYLLVDAESLGQCANFTSEELGLSTTEPLALESILTEGSKVSGLVKAILGSKVLRKKYSANLNSFIEEAREAKKAYNQTVDGPNRKVRSEMKKVYRRNIR